MTLQESSPVWLWDGVAEGIRASHRGHDRVDVLIVGAGMAGVAAAYYLSTEHSDLDVLLVDAQQVGAGATGRSTGIIGPGLSAPMRTLRRRYGDRAAAAAFASTLAGAAEAGRLIEVEGIECDARLEQHIIAALTAAQERQLARHRSDLAELGFPVAALDRESATDRLGSGGHHAALVYDDVLLVNPYQLVTGLAAAAERAGVRICERTRVTRFEERVDGVVAYTPAGDIAADRVLLAMDGYAGGLSPHRRSVVPVRTHVLATAPLTTAQRDGLGWDGSGGVIDQRNFFSYYRLGAGGRLIFGGGPAQLPDADPRHEARASAVVYDRLERELRTRFPALRDAEIEAKWSGLTGGTLDRLPVVGRVDGHPRVHYAGGWCGHGLAMCVSTARHYTDVLAGDVARGVAEARDKDAVHGDGTANPGQLLWFRPGTLGLPEPVRAAGLPAYLRGMDIQDRIASVRSRRVDTRAASAAGDELAPARPPRPRPAGQLSESGRVRPAAADRDLVVTAGMEEAHRAA